MTATGVETELWGEETSKAVANFPVSGQPIPVPVVRWLGRIKAAAARVNAELGLLDAEIAERIATAGDEVAAGEHDDQFPIDVFQTGSGTSSNMNANEVMANLAGDGAHPNDHVNMGQSSNDVFPSAVHLAALGEVSHDLLPAMDELAVGARAKGRGVRRRRQGRAHPPDGCGPGDARPGVRRLRRADQARAATGCAARCGASARSRSAAPPPGPGLNTHSEFAERVRAKLAEDTGLEISEPLDPFEAQGNRDALVELSGALKVVAVSLTKIANDLALMGSGPARRAGRAAAAGAPEGLLDHARQGQPGDLRGGDPGRRPGDRQRRGDHDRRLAGPVRAQRPGATDRPQPARLDQAAGRRLPPARHQVRAGDRGRRGDGRAPRRGDAWPRRRRSTRTSATTAATEIVKEAHESGRPLREVAREMGVDEEILEQALDHRRMARPHD